MALKILINQDLDFDPLTSEERKFWNSFAMGKERATNRQSHREDTTLQYAGPNTSGPSPASTSSHTSTSSSTSGTGPGTSYPGAINLRSSSLDATTRPSALNQDAPITGTGTIRTAAREIKVSPDHPLGTESSRKLEAPNS